MLGSVGYVNAARGVLIVGNPPDIENGPERVVAMPKSNTSPPVASLRFRLESRQVSGMLPDGTPGSVDVVGITWLGEDTASADDLLGTNEDRTLTAEAKEWLPTRSRTVHYIRPRCEGSPSGRHNCQAATCRP